MKSKPTREDVNCATLWKTVDGAYHREDGPAMIFDSGEKSWWVDNKIHRLDGPAIIEADGTESFYIKGREYLEEDYYTELFERGLISEDELFIHKL